MGESKEFAEIRFLDYRGSTRRNKIRQWLDDIPTKARMKIQAELGYLRNNPDLWKKPRVKPLKGPGRGLLEIRVFSQGVQYRPILFRGPEPHEATLLIGSTKRQKKFDPPNAIETAQKRKKEIEEDDTRIVDHDYS